MLTGCQSLAASDHRNIALSRGNPNRRLVQQSGRLVPANLSVGFMPRLRSKLLRQQPRQIGVRPGPGMDDVDAINAGFQLLSPSGRTGILDGQIDGLQHQLGRLFGVFDLG